MSDKNIEELLLDVNLDAPLGITGMYSVTMRELIEDPRAVFEKHKERIKTLSKEIEEDYSSMLRRNKLLREELEREKEKLRLAHMKLDGRNKRSCL